MSIYYQINTQSLTEQAFDCFIVPVFKNNTLSKTGQLLDALSQGQMTRLVSHNLQNESGAIFMLPEPHGITSKHILFVYCHDQSSYAVGYFQKLMKKIATAITCKSIHSVGCYVEDFPEAMGSHADKVQFMVQAFEASHYNFGIFKNPKKTDHLLKTVHFCFNDLLIEATASLKNAIQMGQAIASGITLTKDLVNAPSNLCTPSYFAQVANSLTHDYPTLQLEVLDTSHEVIQKMGAFCAVAQGSDEPAKFVVIYYKPFIEDDRAPIVLIGKGVTFDSGGISLKPSRHMDEMKSDMAGAASVLGTIKAIAQLKCSMPVIGILPLTENLPSGSATKPGDIIKSLSGTTIEILDTDAEGRLILADALTYSLQFNPTVIIDLATLTGAVIVALGNVVSGLMSTHDELSQAIIHAGKVSGDRVWRLPCWEEYQEFIKSKIADIANVGAGGAGSITAACFLKHFAQGKPWAHLDIGGTAFDEKFATGRGVPLLVQYIVDYCKKQ